MTAALEGGEWSAARPGSILPPGKTRYPFYRRLGGLQGRSGRGKNFVPIGIWSRTVQPVITILCSTAKCELISGSGTDMSVVSFSETSSTDVTNSTDLTNWPFMKIFNDLNHMTPGTVVFWTLIYIATNLIWLVSSGILFYGRLHKKHTQFLWPIL
jgi:hypothetical protein